METILNKLRKVNRYPHFDSDVARVINDLITHVTNERGIYSSSVEPNPDEHKIWFNTDTNTLMIYNNNAWRYFNDSEGSEGSEDSNGSNSSSKWSVETALLYRNSAGNLEIGNIKDKTFYILNVDINVTKYIEIPNLSDDIEFYIFISSMPERLYFPNSNIITNYDTIVRHTTTNKIDGMSVLAHKVGITVEFSIINDKTDGNDKNYIYNTKLEKVYIGFVGTNGKQYTYIATPIDNKNNINQINIRLPSNYQGNYTVGSFSTNNNIQIVYPPLRYEISNEYTSSVCIFKNPSSETELKVLSSLEQTSKVSQGADLVCPPIYAVFDRFNPDNADAMCTTYYFNCLNDDNCGLIIRDNWYFKAFDTGIYEGEGLSIIIDDFPINTDNYFFNTDTNYFCNDLIINNSSDDNRIKSLIERIVRDDFKFTDYHNYVINLRGASLIYTTNYKSKYIGIPHNQLNGRNQDDILVIIANKLRNDTEIITGNIDIAGLGKITIVTIPENIVILKNLINTNIYTNVTINDTLTVGSEYDDKGLLFEHYNYYINDSEYGYDYERPDTPIIA